MIETSCKELLSRYKMALESIQVVAQGYNVNTQHILTICDKALKESEGVQQCLN